jgi:hypothetical protein
MERWRSIGKIAWISTVLRRERLARAKELLAQSEMGSLLCFDMNNVRYLTATHIGTWAQDKANRFTLLPQNGEPILWDFGSAAKHHQLHCPWLGERSRPGISMLRGAMTPEMGRAEDVAKKIRIELEMRGLHKEPVGIDIIELPVLSRCRKKGSRSSMVRRSCLKPASSKHATRSRC